MSEIAPQLLRFTLGLVGDRAVAEEAAQEALVALVQRWRKHGPPESPAAFAFAVARRRATRQIWRRRLLDPLSVVLDRESDAASGPEALAVGRIDARRVLEALRRLARRDREAVLLVAAAELGMQEAAASAGVSVSAFKMRLHRARRRLRAALEGTHDRA